jgi:hypothetical protein
MDPAEFGYPLDPNPVYPGPELGAPPGIYTGPPSYPAPPTYTDGAAWQSAYRQVDPHGYPGGYPAPSGPLHSHRADQPAAITAVSVLAFIVSGLLLLSGFVILVGASAAQGLHDGGHNDQALKLIFAGLANLASGGLLTAGAISTANRQPRGRGLLAYGTAICVASAILWLEAQGSRDLLWTVVFCGPALVATGLALGPQVTGWLTSDPRQSPAGT